MKKIIYIIGGVALLALITFNFSGCIDKSFNDIEPRVDSTSIKANTTIAELKSAYPGELVKLTDTTFYKRDSIIIEGIVTSDDQAGNFYKSIVIQDATGGIEVKLDKTTLYNDYKRGQRVIVICNDLYLGDYGGLIQIGSTFTENGYRQIGGIEGDVMINKHLYRKGRKLVAVTPLTLLPNMLTANNFSKLVKVDNVQFKVINSPENNKHLTFADKIGGESIDHIVKGCINNYNDLLVLRSSGYAKFANDTIPSRNGSIIGVLSYYNGTYQLIVRDLKDINFVNARCN
ncbi:MAG: hypothetical protein HXX16_08470 [Bacteroidales bacterium]|nr:hypothetical protein [Bacteroidales bacterium]